MGYEALQAAIANFRGERWSDGCDEAALVCKCFGVGEGVIERAVKMNRLTTIEEVTAYTKAGGGCSTCAERLDEILARANAELVADGRLAQRDAYRRGTVAAKEIEARPAGPRQAAPQPEKPKQAPQQPLVQVSPLAPVSPPLPAGMTNLQKIKLIEETIEELRPFLRKDGGDCELIDIENSNVLVKLTGACVLCRMASVTISEYKERLVAKLGIPLRIIPVGKGAH